MSENIDEFIHKTKWLLTGSIYQYFETIDKLYKEKQITKSRYDWLVKERPIKLIKELIDKHLLIKEVGGE